MRKPIFAVLALACAATFVSCEKDDPEIPNEEELITTLKYTLTPASGGNAVVLEFKDLDGDGGSAPVITTDDLQANTTYTGVLDLLNETETPAESITEEIEEESLDHQFFFSSTKGDLTVAYDDQDDAGNPLGLKTTINSGSAGNGTLTITLRHEPDKNASGVSSGNIQNAGGETDIEVTFDIIVK